MALYHIGDNTLTPIRKTAFEHEALRERQDIQRLLKENIEVLEDDLLVISEEYGEFEESRRRIDLLAVDSDANLVVIEIKRTSDGGHMELQAIRYAAMIANMTWENAIDAYDQYLDSIEDAETKLLDFLKWDEPKRDEFANRIRIILTSADFSKEITTSVLWLNQMDLDITCIRLELFKLNNELIINSQQIIPLPETENYQIAVREKRREIQAAKESNKDRSTYTLLMNNEVYEEGFKKSDLGYIAVTALNEYGLLDQAAFEFLRVDKSCSFQLLKTLDEITDNEKKYSKYRYKKQPEIIFNNEGYFVARNWGVLHVDGFIEKLANQFKILKILQD